MKLILCLCAVFAIAAGQRITTIQLDGVQYFVSRMNPYSPELNYFLSYQYCRSLGLQLASFETKEKVESMTQYLLNAGFSQYDFWTSGNRLGTGMFLWMSTGLPFNATFDYFENSKDSVQTGLLDPIDHNSNTSPQRTARDSSSGLDKGCVRLKAPSLRWAPDDCSVVKDFICEQTRCYYYNYGSIPVSSSQGRPISQLSSTTTEAPTSFTIASTPLPMLLMSSTMNPSSAEPQSTTMSDEDQAPMSEEVTEEDESINNAKEEQDQDDHLETTTTVEQRLKQISEEIEKFSSNTDTESEIGRQSFFSLSDLIKTLRPTDKKIPQIDSDYSNTMRVLGETSSMEDGSRKFKDTSSEISNRALN